MADIFLSYARPDREKIASLAAALEQACWSVWWDRHIDGGAAFANAIETELNASRVVIVAWSQASLQSDWVKDEAATARDQGKLVPVSVDGAVAPLGFKQYHVIDLSTWHGDPSAPAFAIAVLPFADRVQPGSLREPASRHRIRRLPRAATLPETERPLRSLESVAGSLRLRRRPHFARGTARDSRPAPSARRSSHLAAR